MHSRRSPALRGRRVYRAETAPGRLWAWRPDEDRIGPDRVAGRRAGGRNTGLTHRDADLESRLGTLAGRDLAGSLKYDRSDARDILERASARETVARVACGAVCKKLLGEFDIEIGSHVVELGGVAAKPISLLPSPLNEAADASPLRCLDKEAEAEMIRRID